MNNWFKYFYNPFDRIAGWKAFGLGTVIAAISVWIAYSTGNYFVGVINIRYAGTSVELIPSFLFHIQGMLCLMIIMYIAGVIFSKGVRFQDIAGTVILARYPYFFAALALNLTKGIDMDNLAQNILDNATKGTSVMNSDILNITLFSIILLIIVIWYISLLFNAFRVSTGIKGSKGIGIFIIIIILAEVVNILVSLITTKFI